MSSLQPSAEYDDQFESISLSELPGLRKEDEILPMHPDHGHYLSRAGKFLIWRSSLWPLLLHGALTALISCFTIYVNRGNFNISERRPTVRLHDDTIVPWISFTLLQSDITTILLVSISILRLIVGSWLGSLCWRCAFILLEEVGLKPKQLRYLISYSITSVPLSAVSRGKRVILWLIWATLALTIPAQFSAPVLTGSITWVPGHHRPQILSNLTIATPLYNGDRLSWEQNDFDITWNSSTDYLFLRLDIARGASSLAFLAWGRETQGTTLRRFLPGLRLETNSTLTNITLPYFSIQAIEWVNDPKSNLSVEQLDIRGIFCPAITGVPYTLYCPALLGLVLIPDFPWLNRAPVWPPQLSVIAERRLIAKRVGNFTSNPNSISGCKFYSGSESNLDSIGPDHAVYVDSDNSCYVFAWVTYVAGASTCHDCPVSAYGTVQNNTSLFVKRDFLTDLALRFIPDTSAEMGQRELIDMAPTWKHIDEFVAGMLTRSYAASWMALTEGLGQSTLHNTTYSISAPSSQALVNVLRVYIWLGLQSLITLSGILFIYTQSRTGTPVIADTTLAAFYLDTSTICQRDRDHKAPLLGRVEFEEDRLRLKSE